VDHEENLKKDRCGRMPPGSKVECQAVMMPDNLVALLQELKAFGKENGAQTTDRSQEC
jgi:hypothetical protein